MFENSWTYDLLINELAHAKQFDEKPFVSTIESMKGIGISCVRSFVSKHKPHRHGNSLTLAEAYKYEYSRQGSFEYKAHSVIARKLEAKFENVLEHPIEDITY